MQQVELWAAAAPRRGVKRRPGLLMGTMLLLLLAAAALASVAALERLSGLPVESTFSFTLGEVPSAALLPKWQKSVTTYPLRGGGNRTRTRTIYFQPGAAPAGTLGVPPRGGPSLPPRLALVGPPDLISWGEFRTNRARSNS